MIYGWMNSAKRIRDIKIFADANRGRILDFAMPRDGRGTLRGGVVVDAVLCPFTKESATICLKMAD
jgi:hypothetical protein